MDMKMKSHEVVFGNQEVLRPPSDRVFYGIIFTGIFALFIITYPYRDIHIPGVILAMGGLISMMALFLFAWTHPQYYLASIAFCIYIPFSGEYAGDFNEFMMGMNLTNLLIFPIALQWYMQRAKMNERLVRLHVPDIAVLIFCILSSMSVLRVGIEAGGASFGEQFIRLKRWLLPFVIYFLFVNTARNEKGVRYLIITICATITAIAILTMKESYDIGPGGTWDRIRVRGVLGQPNSTGAFFVYYTLIFLGFFLCFWRDRRFWLLLIPFLLCGRAMTLANSRGGMIAFTIAILMTLWFRAKSLFLLALGVIVLGVMFPQYLPETISGRLIYGTFQPSKSATVWEAEGERDEDSIVSQMDSSAQGRMAIWKAGMVLFWQRPWLGHGYGTFPYKVRAINWRVGGRDPHSTYLGIAVEMGVLALFFFVLSLLLIFRSCLSVYHHARDDYMRAVGLAGVGMLMGVMSANFFGSVFDTMELTAYFWILSALIVQYDSEIRARARARVTTGDRLIIDPWAQESEEEEEEEWQGA